jgi:ABC-type phosphate/phosphonate transport system substrate-binding protein
MSRSLAALPMYDWPELAPATDRLWVALRDALRAEGVAAPDGLDREIPLGQAWTDPGLVLGQTCGLPLVRDLAGRVEVVGAADYALPGCPPGWYRSAVVVRRDAEARELAAFRGRRIAINGRDSQSGWASILHHVRPDGEAFFGAAMVSGAHRESVRMVAKGAADLAAIDCVSWRYARRFVPEAAGLRVLFLTSATPGLPFIAAAGTDRARHLRALRAGFAALDAPARQHLGIAGFAPLAAADYAIVADRLASALTPAA